MSLIYGTYRDGRIDLDAPVSLPEGARVAVVVPNERIGMTEAEWPDTPEGRAELISRLHAIEPLELTAEDEAEILSARGSVREASIEAVRRQMGLATWGGCCSIRGAQAT